MIRLNLYVSHPQKTAQTRQIKLDEKRDSRQKALGLFCVYGGISRGEERSRDRGKRMKTAYVSEDHWWLESEENK